MDWDKLISKFGIYNFFSRAEMQFRMTRRDIFNEEEVVIANSSDHDILNDHNSMSVKLKTSDDDWTLMVGFIDGFSAPWLWWGTACICLGSLLASSLVMMVLTITEMNKMLLYRMMPRKAIIVVEQGKTFVEREDEATILFSQVLGFEQMSGEMTSKDFLLMLTQLYTEFDKLALKFHCTKIETIGAYYIVKGPDPDFCGYGECEGVSQIALFALHAIELVRNYQYKGVRLQIRAGFATGPVVAGVIGSGGLPKYTVFGDTVNFSSRMESTSQPMKIQCSHQTYNILRNSVQFVFDLEEREDEGGLGVYVKGKGQTMTYWLLGYTVRKAACCGH
jgi:class 3 adenylate cyclase